MAAKRVSALIAINGSLKEEADKARDQIAAVARQADFMDGFEKTWQPLTEPDNPHAPPKRQGDSKRVRVTAEEVLSQLQRVMTAKWDTSLTLDTGNVGSVADVRVDGEVLLRNVPVGHLLYLARELDKIGEIVTAIPVLANDKEWTADGTPAGIHRTARPVVQYSTDKEPYVLVLSPATAQHPQRDQVMTRDVQDGWYTTTAFSGALTFDRKARIIERVAKLQAAVKEAREEANTRQVEEQHEGDVIFGYLLS
ncbi:MAG TPA: hypothetical protein VHE33_10015 [Acidobacteriaceae bacterium]|nr:hypothetical protein [Acidobacteriaceae bacterium]